MDISAADMFNNYIKAKKAIESARDPFDVDWVGQPNLDWVGDCLPLPPIKCKDGFTMSVQASIMHYCTPRTSEGPWTHFEVGMPSCFTADLMPWAEDASKPTDTVYGHVPVHVIVAIINKHGGIV